MAEQPNVSPHAPVVEFARSHGLAFGPLDEPVVVYTNKAGTLHACSTNGPNAVSHCGKLVRRTEVPQHTAVTSPLCSRCQTEPTLLRYEVDEVLSWASSFAAAGDPESSLADRTRTGWSAHSDTSLLCEWYFGQLHDEGHIDWVIAARAVHDEAVAAAGAVFDTLVEDAWAQNPIGFRPVSAFDPDDTAVPCPLAAFDDGWLQGLNADDLAAGVAGVWFTDSRPELIRERVVLVAALGDEGRDVPLGDLWEASAALV